MSDELVQSVGPDFPSRYESRCPWCKERWDAGAIVAYVNFASDEKAKVHCRDCADIFRGWLGGKRVVGRWERAQRIRQAREQRWRELQAEREQEWAQRR